MSEKNPMLYRYISVAMVLFGALFAGPTNISSQEPESTAHLDLRLMFEDHWQEFYDTPLMFDMLQTRLPEVTKEAEKADAANWISEFARRGFRQDQTEYRLFTGANEEVRTSFLGALKGTEYKLDTAFLQQVCRDYAGPGNWDFRAFTEDAWIDFSKAAADKDSYKAMTALLQDRTAVGDAEDYLRLLYYGYRSYNQHQTDLDNDVRRFALDAKGKTARDIEAFYLTLKNASYWENLESKRGWMVMKNASRLYRDYSPDDWATLREMDNVLALARLLEQASTTTEYSPVALEKWLDKIGSSVKAAPDKAKSRPLLAYFVANTDPDRQESYRSLRPKFLDDQAMFIVLHDTPPQPSPMGLWHENSDNLTDSFDLLEQFLDVKHAAHWNASLWHCLRDWYYCPHEKHRDRLFKKAIQPIAEDQSLADNAVRQALLQDTSQDGSFLLDSHRYEIAHSFLSQLPMTDTVALPAVKPEVLEFAIDTYGDLDPLSGEVFRSRALQDYIARQGLRALDASEPKRIVAFVNAVLGEPLTKMCDAFMGRTDRTHRVKFSLDNRARVKQLETLLGKMVFWKKKLRDEYGQDLQRFEILEEILKDIIAEMEKAIDAGDKERVVAMVHLTLKICVLLHDDYYIERVLTALRENVFEIPKDGTLFRQLNKTELEQMVKYFNQLHPKDILETLAIIEEAKYVEMFYDRLYVPLRSIDRFFATTGAEPYMLFLDAFKEQGVDIRTRFEGELKSFGAIHGLEGPSNAEFIHAEAEIAALLDKYYSLLKLSPWEHSEKLTLSRNVNLGVFYRMLFKVALEDPKGTDESWRLKGLTDAQRAKCYDKVARVFLNNMHNAMRMDKPEAKYNPRQLLPLLKSLADLHEIHGYPIPGHAPTLLYEQDSSPVSGIQRAILNTQSDLKTRHVDGTLRADVYKGLSAHVKETSSKNQMAWQSLLRLVVLLPNSEANHLDTADSSLQDYAALKQEAFEHTCQLFDNSVDTELKVQWLIWLCRLEASVFGLGDRSVGLGYEEVRQRFLNSLGDSPEALVAFSPIASEEFRLIRVNRQLDDTDAGASLLTHAALARQLCETLQSDYILARTNRNYDSAWGAVLDLIRETIPDRVLERLRKEHLAEFWFLTVECRNVLLQAANRGADKLSPEEQVAVAEVASRLVFLHSYFAPYTHAEFSVDAMYNLDYALPLFCMLDRNSKRPVVELLPMYEAVWEQTDALVRSNSSEGEGVIVPRMEPKELKTFLICHNFLPMHLLEGSLDDFERFRKLVQGREVTMTAYNFRLLWERKDRATISLDSLCSEVFDGVDLNREILGRDRKFQDEDYLEYFFGDMRSIIDRESKFGGQMPQNLDAVVRRFVKLPEDPRLAGLKSRLAGLLEDSSIEFDERQRLTKARAELDTVRERVDTILAGGFDYFGQVLVDRFRSPFTIQRACETAGEKIVEAKSSGLTGDAWDSYVKFYESAVFGDDGFRPELAAAISSRFYTAPTEGQSNTEYLATKRSEMSALIDGSQTHGTNGFANVARQLSAKSVTRFDKQYVQSGKGLLRSLFYGEGAAVDAPFIGDLIWRRNQDGTLYALPLDYESRESEIKSMLKWLAEAGERYRDVPKIRNVFVDR